LKEALLKADSLVFNTASTGLYLEKLFEKGATVNVDSLRAAGIVGSRSAKVKVLGRGEVTKALTVQAHKFSGKAAEKIAAAGGKAEAIAS